MRCECKVHTKARAMFRDMKGMNEQRFKKSDINISKGFSETTFLWLK